MDRKESSIVRNIVIKTERLLLARKAFGVTHFCASHAEPNLASGRVIAKCGLEFVRYGIWSKLDGSCKMRSMEYERVDV